MPREGIPRPVLDSRPELIEFYWLAWELAWNHVLDNPRAAQTPFMDEGVNPDVVWIWDTCFMALFCRYAPTVFPGIESLNNFYLPMHDGIDSGVMIQHPDNPPLFAWV